MVNARLFLCRNRVRSVEEMTRTLLNACAGKTVYRQLLEHGIRYIEKRPALVPCSMRGHPQDDEQCIILDSRRPCPIEYLAREVAYVLGARMLEERHPYANDSGIMKHECLRRFAREWLLADGGSNFAELAIILKDIAAQRDGYFEIKKVR